MTHSIRAFISYSSYDREIAAGVKAALSELGVSGFLAHDDIHVSQEWRERILEELRAMHVFICLLSTRFKESDWGSQEVGVAVSRPEVLIVPVSLDGTVPYGFIAAYQGRRLPVTGGSAFFRNAIATKYPREIIGLLIDALASSGGWRIAEANFRPLLPYLSKLTADEAQRLAEAAVANSEIWDAGSCRSDYLPRFIESNRHQITPSILTALEYQIEHGTWYLDRPEA